MMLNPLEILKASILLVDDQDANVRLLQRLLFDAGYINVTSTTVAQEVSALHRKNCYDLILLDLQMPGMDGFEVMEALKADAADGYLPVVVLTAQPAHKLRALQAGAKDFISKPFDLAEVNTRIHNMLETRLLYKRLQFHNHLLEQAVQKRSAELEASEGRLRNSNGLASDWYWEQNLSANATQVNVTEVSGPALGLMGIGMSAFLGESDGGASSGWIETEKRLLQSKMANRQSFRDFAFSRISADGTKRHFKVSGEPMFNDAGLFAGYRGIGVELTAKVRAAVLEAV